MAQGWILQSRRRMARYRRCDWLTRTMPPPNPSEGANRALEWEVRQSYGEWFESLPWDLFATYTMPFGSTLGQLVRCHKRWSSEMARENDGELRQVFAIEWQRNGTPHGHALVYGIAPGNESSTEGWHAAKLWERVGGGIARIWPYRGKGGAASYCAKYVTKRGDLSLLGPWPSVPSPGQLSLGPRGWAWGHRGHRP